ncbi:MAG: hypothetical protein QOH46_3968 [Solirubrobacteraceae bacterium]|jgi:hypothetical protein|nr:hypothetical protein [Solirubrobacteraceae bacterium]
MPEEPEIWGGELDPPQRLRWRRKPPCDDAQNDARAAGTDDETPAPKRDVRAAKRPVKVDVIAAAAVPQPLTRAAVAGAGRRMAEARRGRRRRLPGG